MVSLAEKWKPLVSSPVFLLSGIRSGSTLLRCILDTNPEICAPIELHLGYLSVSPRSEFLEQSLGALGADAALLRAMLWDRVYYELLRASGKRVLVDKSPSNLWVWEDLPAIWPEAKYVFLRRDPAAMVRSIVEARDGRDERDASELVCRTVERMDLALASLRPNRVVDYETLVAAPAEVAGALCEFIGVRFHESMLEYGRGDHGPFEYGLGDWGDRIRSGVVLPGRPVEDAPDDASPLAQARLRWGYGRPGR